MKKKSHLTTLLLVALLLAGLSLLLYPTVSDYWNSFHQTQAISGYVENVAKLDEGAYDQLWEEAWRYNRDLAARGVHYALSDRERADYEAVLDVTGQGIMGYIEIPEIKCTLPIYHGTDEAELQVAIGHLEWSSLPVGGQGSHCVLSGHRGLPSAKLFTNLDQLEVGDIFLLRVLDEVLTYEVDQISIVEPQDVSRLQLQEGQDLCTLVTCTPYGINSHRLLVRGHRVENSDVAQSIRITADAIQIDPLLVAPVVALPMLLILLILVLLPKRRGKNGGEPDESI